MGSQVRIIGGLLSPRAPPRTLSNSREPARAKRGRRREFPAGRSAGRECKVQPLKTGCEARCNKVQQGARPQVETRSGAANPETGCDTLVVK